MFGAPGSVFRFLGILCLVNVAAQAGLPLRFEANVDGTAYEAVCAAHSLRVEAQGAVIATSGRALRMRMLEARRAARLEPLDEQAATTSYLFGADQGKWRSGVKQFARVRVAGVYDRIDAIYYGQGRRLEFDFVVSPGAEPSRIAWELEGADRLRLRDGVLEAEVDGETMRWQAPVAYQVLEGRQETVPAEFVLRGKRVSFSVGRYDRSRPLIIDPVLNYSTYLGARGNEAGASIARDKDGNVYVTGVTTSTTLAVTRGALQSAYGGGTSNRITGDAYVAKYNSAGVLQYLTYLGGAADDYGVSIGVDANGNAYVGGFTTSNNFPTTANAFQRTFGGAGGGQICKQFGDGFISKLNPTGTALVYSTYLGGKLDDVVGSLLVDTDGSVYVAGSTVSTNFPVTSGAYQRSHGGSGGQPSTGKCDGAPSFVTGDAYVAKLDATGGTLLFASFIGGTRDDAAMSIGIDANKNIYVAGSTISQDFPVTNGAFQTKFGGVDDQNFFLHAGDGWVAKLNPTASQLIWATYLGGRQDDLIVCMRVDANGIVTVGGSTGSTNFPTTSTAISRVLAGYYFVPFDIDTNFGDGFIARLNATGSALTYSTYVGGQNNDILNSFWIDAAGLIYAVGWTDSENFKVTVDAQQKLFAGRGGQADFFNFGDGFLTVIDPAVSVPVYSTFVGGAMDDEFIGITGDGEGGVWITGNTLSPNFPVTAAGAQRTYGGGIDYDSIKGDMVLVRINGFVQRTALAAIVNGASNTPNIVSPGMVFVGYGANMGPAALVGAAVDANGKLASTRSGTRILFDGVPAPLVYVSAGQVSGIVPYSVAGKGTTQVTVEVNGQASSPLTLSVAAAAPGLFSLNFSGTGPAVVFNEDGTVNSATNPAAKGSIIVLYGTGEGQTTPAGEDGLIATSVFPKPVLPVSVLVGNVAASEILYAGAVPGNVTGVLQVNARLAPTTPSGTQSLVLRVGSFSSQTGLTVFVR